MTTVFSRIIAGELPARFVWSDEHAVAFLSVNPVAPGHTLVVSRLEVDQWTDAPVPLMAHLMTVAHAVGAAIARCGRPLGWACSWPGSNTAPAPARHAGGGHGGLRLQGRRGEDRSDGAGRLCRGAPHGAAGGRDAESVPA